MNKKISIVFLTLGLAALLIPSCQKSKDKTTSLPDSSDVESESEEEHKHKYSSDWTYDHKYHWHAAICGHDVVKDKAEHNFNEQEITDGDDVYSKFTCTVCGYSYNDNEMFKVKWMSDEDHVIYSENYPKGAMPSYDIDTYGVPTKESEDVAYRYEFSHWSPALSAVNGPQTYTAQYNQVENKYHVTWKDYDNSTLYEHDVQAGQTPVYPYADPTRPDDGYEATYTFEGWDPEPGPISHDTVYTAQYSRHVISDALQFTEIEDGEAYEVSGYNETPNGSLIIPATYHGKPVKGIGYRAFRNCTLMTSVILPDSVTYLDKEAFTGCTNLQSFGGAKLANITSFGAGVFYNCSSFVLSGNSFPSLTAIPRELFFGCRSLGTSIERSVFNNVTTIGDRSFYNCSNIQTLVGFADSSVQTIGSEAFCGCTSLELIALPTANCNSIGSRAFAGCTSLASVRLNNKGVVIQANAFDGCTSLAYLYNYTYQSIVSIGNYAFKGTALTTVNFKTSQENVLTTIGMWAFQDCTAMTVFKLPTSVVSIGRGAICGTVELTELEVPFVGHSEQDTTNQYLGYLYGVDKQNDVASDNKGSGKLNTIRITGSTCTTIRPYAFYNIGKYDTNLILPTSVTTIKEYAFCEYRGWYLNLTNSGVNTNIQTIEEYAIDPAIYTIDIPFIGTRPNRESDKNATNIRFDTIFDRRIYVDLDRVTCWTKIYPSKAFENNKIKEIVIADWFDYISADAFSGISKLTTIRFDGTVSKFRSLISNSDSNWARGCSLSVITCGDGDYTIPK